MGLDDSRQRFLAAALLAIVAAAGGWKLMDWWRRPTAVEFDNLKYIQLLTTAVSSRSLELVEKVETAVRQRRDAEQMSGREYDHFAKLIRLARGGEWQQADRECWEFARAQLSRTRKQPASREEAVPD